MRNFGAMRRTLDGMGKHWIQEFLRLDGIELLLESLRTLTRGKLSLSDAFTVYQCVSCVRIIMNHKAGIDYFVSSDVERMHSLVSGLASPIALVRKAIYELLSALSLYSLVGHSKMLKALEFLKRKKSYQ